MAGREIEGQWCPGYMCYGVPIMSAQFIRVVLMEKVKEIEAEVKKSSDILGEEDLQAEWKLLQCSTVHKLDWLLSLAFPSNIKEVARYMDGTVWRVLERLARSDIPWGESGLGWECTLAAPHPLHRRSYQRWVVGLPIKPGGLEVRLLEETRGPAFIGGVEQGIGQLEPGLYPQLEAIVGKPEERERRWEHFLEQNTRTGEEFHKAWGELRAEAAAGATFLGEDDQGIMADPAAEAGGRKEEGLSLRKSVTQQREARRHKVLVKCLADHPIREARPVMAFQNVDKMAGSWLLASPGARNGLSAPVFAEAMVARLCLPSPALMSGRWIGKPVGHRQQPIDRFWDRVMCCN